MNKAGEIAGGILIFIAILSVAFFQGAMVYSCLNGNTGACIIYHANKR